MGHEPKTEPVEPHVEKNNAYCFEDQTVAEAEQIMLDANVAEVPVVTREKLVGGTTCLLNVLQSDCKRALSSRLEKQSSALAPKIPHVHLTDPQNANPPNFVTTLH